MHFPWIFKLIPRDTLLQYVSHESLIYIDEMLACSLCMSLMILIVLIKFRYDTPFPQIRLMPCGLSFYGHRSIVKNRNKILTFIASSYDEFDLTMRVQTGVFSTVLVTIQEQFINKLLTEEGLSNKSRRHYRVFDWWLGKFFYKSNERLQRFRTHATRFCKESMVTRFFIERSDWEMEKMMLYIIANENNGCGKVTYHDISVHVFNIMQAMTYGVTSTPRNDDDFYELLTSVHEFANHRIFWNGWRPYKLTGAYFEHVLRKLFSYHRITDIFYDYVKDCDELNMGLPLDGWYFLNKLYRARLTERDVKEMSSYFHFNGQETVTSAVVFTLHVLSWYEDLQDEVYKEQKKVFGNRFHADMSTEKLNSLTFLNNVIVETLRMYPPIPIIYRELLKDYRLTSEPCIVPKGTEVWIHLFGYLRRGAPTFDKTRCYRRQNEKPPPFVFGHGMNTCIGKDIALRTIKIFVSRIVQRYRIVSYIQENEIDSLLQVETVLKTKHIEKPFKLELRTYDPLPRQIPRITVLSTYQSRTPNRRNRNRNRRRR